MVLFTTKFDFIDKQENPCIHIFHRQLNSHQVLERYNPTCEK
jgi:hypothetical protein